MDTQEKMLAPLTARLDVDKLFTDLDKVTQAELLAMSVSRAGFGTRHRDLTFGGYYPEMERDISKLCARFPCPSLMLSGALGVGKTALMSAALKVFVDFMAKEHKVLGVAVPIRIGSRCWFITHDEFNGLCRAEIKDGDLLARPDDIIREPLVLILDDLLDVSRSEYLSEKLERLINHRWTYRKATWITSNLKLADLEHIPGYARVVSRLSDDAWMNRWIIPGKDLRLPENR